MALSTVVRLLEGRLLPRVLGPSDDFGRTCHGLALGRPTCLLTWAAVNLVAVCAPPASLTDQDLASLGASALLLTASAARRRRSLRLGGKMRRLLSGGLARVS